MTTRRTEMRGREINADDGAGRRDQFVQPGERFTGSASRIQHTHSRREAQGADGPAKLRLSEGIEKREFRRVIAGGCVAQQSACRCTQRGALDHGAPARVARKTCIVAGRTGREASQRAMRRPCERVDHGLSAAQAWVFALAARAASCSALGRTRLAA